jgi:hypothetical protein
LKRHYVEQTLFLVVFHPSPPSVPAKLQPTKDQFVLSNDVRDISVQVPDAEGNEEEKTPP